MVASKSILVLLWNFGSLDAGAAAVLMKSHFQFFEGAQNLILRLVGLQESVEIQTNAGYAIGKCDNVFGVFDLVASERFVPVAEAC